MSSSIPSVRKFSSTLDSASAPDKGSKCDPIDLNSFNFRIGSSRIIASLSRLLARSRSFSSRYRSCNCFLCSLARSEALLIPSTVASSKERSVSKQKANSTEDCSPHGPPEGPSVSQLSPPPPLSRKDSIEFNAEEDCGGRRTGPVLWPRPAFNCSRSCRMVASYFSCCSLSFLAILPSTVLSCCCSRVHISAKSNSSCCTGVDLTAMHLDANCSVERVSL
mmetsp:Transcript_25369/g.37416  ORF Transcript_25369/g.37416 Transcript_25369/m.37416 type:complete len:221 (+) Transcript_25369:1376-2038(+)